MEEDKQVVELVARCIDDLVDASDPDNHLHFFGLGLVPSTVPVTQDYILKYLFNRIGEEMKYKIVYDDILYSLITEQPKDVCLAPESMYYRPRGSLRPSLAFSKEYINIGKKYKTQWKQIYKFLLGQSDKWWTTLSIKWRQEIGERIFSAPKHHERQKEREGCLETMVILQKFNIPDEIQNCIMNYLCRHFYVYSFI